MSKYRVASSLALLALGAHCASASAQDFLPNTARTIPAGDLRFTAYPTALFGKNNAPDRWGGAGRVGYGITDNFDVQGKAAVFDGFGLVGLDTSYWILRGDVNLGLSLGAHKALMQSAPDSTAVDASWQMSTRLYRRLRFEGGMSVSLESIDHVRNSRFSRVYVVPGVNYRISHQVDFVSQLGLGLNNNSPNYLTAGFSFDLPVTESARRRGPE